MHVASNKFLCCKFEEAELQKENYKLELSKYSSDNTFFKFLASYKHQSDSEGIIYSNDVIYITCAGNYLNKQPYIHCH